MGVQPIDLQTMYSQMSNLAKQVAHSEQGIQLAKSMQQIDVVKADTEQTKKVQQAGEDAKSATVNQNGSGGQSYPRGKKKDSGGEHDAEPGENPDKFRLKESYLGQHIDITR